MREKAPLPLPEPGIVPGWILAGPDGPSWAEWSEWNRTAQAWALDRGYGRRAWMTLLSREDRARLAAPDRFRTVVLDGRRRGST